ncbi:MAG: hypothetical protein R3E73_10515 [Porticoccaceae bacterium]|nr:hypothetical protein [Pseudomonadales bacterium]MCP5171080.1 hypothetical protein [Pseudomonadales bacterium]MCP5301681.1 hypothetical protein [Pseudomonadales bacterium]
MSTRDVADKFMRSIESMDFPAAFGLLADDGEYTVIGTTEASGKYYGPQEMIEKLLPALSDFIEPPALTFEDPIVDGDRVVMLASGEGVGPTGPYKQPYYAFVATVKGDRFSSVIEFMDTEMLNTGIFGKS